MEYNLAKHKQPRPLVGQESPKSPRGSPVRAQPAAAKRQPPKAGGFDKGEHESHNYTDEEIDNMTRNYILVPAELLADIPVGSHIRYIKKDPTGETPRGLRFKPGGYVQKIITKQADGKKYIVLDNRIGGAKSITWSIQVDAIETVWKRLDNSIEMHLMRASLEHKMQLINDLTAEVKRIAKELDIVKRRVFAVRPQQ